MSDFVTVFEISWNSNGELAETIVRLLIGVVAVVGGVIVLVRRWRHGDNVTKHVGTILVILWGSVWLYLGAFPHVFGHISRLVNAYHQKQYDVVEGPVQVLYQQPATGHTKGDVIHVNGKEFEVNYFYATPAYHNTIAHKGILNAGSYARIYFLDGEILRVDIKR
jgi:hypothetical protein